MFEQKQISTDHATLTLLSDGGVVIGWPRDGTKRDCTEVADAVEKWLEEPDHSHTTLMFPWPVDVTDLRQS